MVSGAWVLAGNTHSGGGGSVSLAYGDKDGNLDLTYQPVSLEELGKAFSREGIKRIRENVSSAITDISEIVSSPTISLLGDDFSSEGSGISAGDLPWEEDDRKEKTSGEDEPDMAEPEGIEPEAPEESTPKTLKDIGSSLYKDFLDPASINSAYYLNLPVAALSTIGEISEYAGENIVYQVNKIPGGKFALEAIGSIAGGIIDKVQAVIGSGAKLVLSEEQLKTIAKEYQELPHGVQVLSKDIGDGAILGGAAKLASKTAGLAKSNTLYLNKLLLKYLCQMLLKNIDLIKTIKNLLTRIKLNYLVKVSFKWIRNITN